MKRILILFSTVLLMVFSAGCGEQEVDVEKENKDESQTEDVEEETSEEDDKEDPIEVEIEANPVIEKGKVYIEGETNIPDHAELMFTISNDEYKGQSTEVVEGGKFKTETFTDDGDSLPVGEYELSISLSVPNTQDDKFVKVAGEEYENLTGDLMEESDLGKSMSYSMTFDIDEGEGAAKDEKTKENIEEVNEDVESEIDKEFEKAFGNASKVRNDTTGNWRVVVTSKKFDVEEMLFDYHDNFMKEGEIHFIVSFATNTTTVIRNMSGMISSEVHEYVDKEEHDAKTLGSGMILAEYIVDSDGEIEKIN